METHHFRMDGSFRLRAHVCSNRYRVADLNRRFFCALMGPSARASHRHANPFPLIPPALLLALEGTKG